MVDHLQVVSLKLDHGIWKFNLSAITKEKILGKSNGDSYLE
jgi:hypothetical protein